MKEIIVTRENFKTEVLEQNGFVLLDFWAAWCGPCKMLSPIVHEIAEEYENIKVGKIDVDAEMELAQMFRIASIPTLILFRDGKPVKQQVGYASKQEIIKMWEN